MSLLELERPKVFKNVKEAPMLLLLLTLLADISFNWLYIHFFREAFAVPGVYTNELIQPLFVLSALKLAFIVVGIVFWIGRFKPFHLGISWKNLKFGLLTTFFMWAILQIAQIADSLLTQGQIDYFNTINSVSAALFLGNFLLFAAGKAFFDEVIYRGLLLPQFHLKLQRYVNLPTRVILAIALVASQLIYFIIQLPLISLVHVNEFSSAITITSLLFLSLLNALVYLRTKNLYVTIGIHALWYAPLFVISPTIPHTLILSLVIILFIVIWPMLPNSPSLMATWPLDERPTR